ncbi:hypothetical protein [Kineothrix sedimenti]|uniref:Uncharacterized protein n=1 Tax=Kineothrix sedimenti TaxID=3123317 RepID=A0ABZ3F363_9FIRM
MEKQEAVEILEYYEKQPWFFSKDASALIAFNMAISELKKSIPVVPEDKYVKTYICPPDCGGEEFDKYGFVPHCPVCGEKFGDFVPKLCPECGKPIIR